MLYGTNNGLLITAVGPDRQWIYFKAFREDLGTGFK